MKPTIKNLQDSFTVSKNVYKDPDIEAQEIVDAYHNRQYTQVEIDVLTERVQPVETFNVIKTYANAIGGYFNNVVNTVKVTPRYMSNPTSALLLDDVTQFVLEENEFDSEASKVVLDGLLTGKMCVYYKIEDTGAVDAYGRKIKSLKIEHVPAWQVRIDPMSFRDDRADAMFIHRWEWVSEEEFVAKWGTYKKNKAEAYSTEGVEDSVTEFENRYGTRLVGKFEEWNTYLVVNTIMRDGDKTWSVVWHNDVILEKKLVPYDKVQFPYRVVLMSNSDKAEHYGPFRDVIETQKAINQALIQIQLLINTKKAFVEADAVENVQDFTKQFNRVNSVVVVEDLNGIQIEDLSRSVLEQYSIIDNALNRIQKVLGVNDSFLGSTFASDSGRKVNLQQNASKSQLTSIVDKVRFMYKMVGTDTVHFIQQYYTSSQILRMRDPINGEKYLSLNQPLTIPTGQVDQYGQPIEQPVFDEEIDPDTGEPLEDEEGNIIMVPLNDPDTDIRFLDVDVKVIAVPYNNADEQNQLLFETFLNGPTGQAVLQTNPAGYYKIAGMQISEMGTKNSQAIAQVLLETGQLVSQGQMDPSLAMGGDPQAVLGGALGGSNGGGPKSQQLQIPTGGQ